MGIFFKILGIIFAVIIVILLSAGIYIWLKWRNLKKFMADTFDADIQASTPSRIHLNEDLQPDWLNSDDIREELAMFESSGFSIAGAYRIKEMPAISLMGMINESESMMAVLYKHEDIGYWTDFAIEYADGRELTVSNAPMGGELETRPGAEKIFAKDKSLSELLEIAKSKKQDGPYAEITKENFRDNFEASYAKDMAWRNERGGASKKEILRVAENMGMDISEDDLETAYDELQENDLDRFHEECIEQFSKETTMSVAEWEEYRDYVFIVTDKIESKSYFLDYLEGFFDFSDEQYSQYEKLFKSKETSKEFFEIINNSLSKELRAKKIGSVSEPVEADIYIAPPETDDY
ncbi:MAG: hypothetical protein GY749_49280 [Desulfobacteraceae bacterium]|nr:hypothetical protein [Desulfobacteraceae bacterium]